MFDSESFSSRSNGKLSVSKNEASNVITEPSKIVECMRAKIKSIIHTQSVNNFNDLSDTNLHSHNSEYNHEVVLINKQPKRVRRVYMLNNKYKVGWIVDTDITQCLICSKEFSFFRMKHHCRACGFVVCQPCSSFSINVPHIEEQGGSRVCKNCIGLKQELLSPPPFSNSGTPNSNGYINGKVRRRSVNINTFTESKQEKEENENKLNSKRIMDALNVIELSQKPIYEEAYRIMRGLIPLDIYKSNLNRLIKDGIPENLANRIWNNKILWLICMHPEDIQKIHLADFRAKYNANGLDLIEMRAIWFSLPDWEVKKHSVENGKSEWKNGFKARLDEMSYKESHGTLSDELRRHPFYQEWDQIPLYNPNKPVLARFHRSASELNPMTESPLPNSDDDEEIGNLPLKKPKKKKLPTVHPNKDAVLNNSVRGRVSDWNDGIFNEIVDTDTTYLEDDELSEDDVEPVDLNDEEFLNETTRGVDALPADDSIGLDDLLPDDFYQTRGESAELWLKKKKEEMMKDQQNPTQPTSINPSISQSISQTVDESIDQGLNGTVHHHIEPNQLNGIDSVVSPIAYSDTSHGQSPDILTPMPSPSYPTHGKQTHVSNIPTSNTLTPLLNPNQLATQVTLRNLRETHEQPSIETPSESTTTPSAILPKVANNIPFSVVQKLEGPLMVLTNGITLSIEEEERKRQIHLPTHNATNGKYNHLANSRRTITLDESDSEEIKNALDPNPIQTQPSVIETTTAVENKQSQLIPEQYVNGNIHRSVSGYSLGGRTLSYNADISSSSLSSSSYCNIPSIDPSSDSYSAARRPRNVVKKLVHRAITPNSVTPKQENSFSNNVSNPVARSSSYSIDSFEGNENLDDFLKYGTVSSSDISEIKRVEDSKVNHSPKVEMLNNNGLSTSIDSSMVESHVNDSNESSVGYPMLTNCTYISYTLPEDVKYLESVTVICPPDTSIDELRDGLVNNSSSDEIHHNGTFTSTDMSTSFIEYRKRNSPDSDDDTRGNSSSMDHDHRLHDTTDHLNRSISALSILQSVEEGDWDDKVDDVEDSNSKSILTLQSLRLNYSIVSHQPRLSVHNQDNRRTQSILETTDVNPHEMDQYYSILPGNTSQLDRNNLPFDEGIDRLIVSNSDTSRDVFTPNNQMNSTTFGVDQTPLTPLPHLPTAQFDILTPDRQSNRYDFTDSNDSPNDSLDWCSVDSVRSIDSKHGKVFLGTSRSYGIRINDSPSLFKLQSSQHQNRHYGDDLMDGRSPVHYYSSPLPSLHDVDRYPSSGNSSMGEKDSNHMKLPSIDEDVSEAVSVTEFTKDVQSRVEASDPDSISTKEDVNHSEEVNNNSHVHDDDDNDEVATLEEEMEEMEEMEEVEEVEEEEVELQPTSTIQPVPPTEDRGDEEEQQIKLRIELLIHWLQIGNATQAMEQIQTFPMNILQLHLSKTVLTSILFHCIETFSTLVQPFEVMFILIDVLHVELSIIDQNGFTPLHYALTKSKELCELFITKGADILQDDASGHCPLSLSLTYNLFWFLQIFQQSGRELELLIYGEPYRKFKYVTCFVYAGYSQYAREIIHRGQIQISPEYATELLRICTGNFEHMKEPIETFELLELLGAKI